MLWLSNPNILIPVNGNLDLRNTSITALPEGLTEGGNLNLWNTQITTLPKSLIVGGTIIR